MTLGVFGSSCLGVKTRRLQDTKPPCAFVGIRDCPSGADGFPGADARALPAAVAATCASFRAGAPGAPGAFAKTVDTESATPVAAREAKILNRR